MKKSLDIFRKTTSFMKKLLDIFRKTTSFIKKLLDIFRKTTSFMKKLLDIFRKTTSALYAGCYCFTEIAACLFLKLIQIDNINSERSQPDKKNP